MNALTREWVAKAEGDYNTASRELRARKAPNYDAVCFHCQQSVEKYLKAFLQDKAWPFPRTHDLVELLELCLPFDPSFELQRDLIKDLTRYAVEFRYPGEAATKEDARAAFRILQAFRDFIRPKFRLRVQKKKRKRW